MSFVAGLLVLSWSAATPGHAKDKGLPSSPEREVYCASMLAQCLADTGPTCSDTYDREDHVARCIRSESEACNRRYGSSSSCVTSPRPIPDPSAPVGGPAGGTLHEQAPERSAPKPKAPIATEGVR